MIDIVCIILIIIFILGIVIMSIDLFGGENDDIWTSDVSIKRHIRR